MIHTNWWH